MPVQAQLKFLDSPLLEELEPRHITKLQELATEVEFQEGEIIFREGEECDQLYLVLSGRVALEILVPGRPVRIQTLTMGDELGWCSVLMRKGRLFQARCAEPVKALCFDGSKLLEVCEQDPAFGMALMHRLLAVVAGRLQATRMQLLDVFRMNQRIAKV